MMACGGVWSSLAEGGPGGVQKEIPIREPLLSTFFLPKSPLVPDSEQ